MEYAPIDLYSVVMSGKMFHLDIYIVFRQICDGVEYLHEIGLAYRALELECCVMTSENAVKPPSYSCAWFDIAFPGEFQT
ncbi:hypothetical protein HYPSUDRAFT_561359 [Hypholoma sublateritium FD-334 SS-4]|uniref:Protein kinase domain-containing protein n=1 Tax=Hypholoma sublateritium (strain FD-334 SS-4) TaxID=945553 RepID=A0A0D2MJK5_HYPSF|nr:hypothetical protein HYPSUDRAFT_561359 [Hypholoma sublateritium FD-334 SS-4]